MRLYWLKDHRTNRPCPGLYLSAHISKLDFDMDRIQSIDCCNIDDVKSGDYLFVIYDLEHMNIVDVIKNEPSHDYNRKKFSIYSTNVYEKYNWNLF